MKHFLLSCLLAAPLSLFAQDNAGTASYEQGSLRYGAKIGTTLNQINNAGMLIGFNGGGFVTYGVLDFMDVQGEVLYAVSGSSQDDYTQYYEGFETSVAAIRFFNRSVSIQSIKIPVMAAFKFASSNKGWVIPKLVVGASYGYTFAAFERHDKEYMFNNGDRSIVGNRLENVLSSYNQSQVEGIIGVNVDFRTFGGRVMTFDLRYHLGLLNMQKFEKPYEGGGRFPSMLAINFATTIF